MIWTFQTLSIVNPKAIAVTICGKAVSSLIAALIHYS